MEIFKNVTDKLCFSEFDGKWVKTKLPPEIKSRFKTENQWLEIGRKLKKNARPVEMHPAYTSSRLYTYYIDEDVEPLSADQKICATCMYRKMEYGQCLVAGQYVSVKGHCANWEFDVMLG